MISATSACAYFVHASLCTNNTFVSNVCKFMFTTVLIPMASVFLSSEILTRVATQVEIKEKLKRGGGCSQGNSIVWLRQVAASAGGNR